MRGTLLNTATVAIGGTLGFMVGQGIPPSYNEIVLSGLGLVTLGIGMKLVLGSKNVLIVAASIAIGGIIGLALGIDHGIHIFADWAKATLGGTGSFTDAVITPSLLFCIGPMTLMGCLQDGLERKIDLLALKSTMDMFAAFFFAAALGWGVVVSAFVVLVFQGTLTLLARPLRSLADDSEMIAEASAAGGVIMLAIGLKLLHIKDLAYASYLPAIFLAPVFVSLSRRFLPKKTERPLADDRVMQEEPSGPTNRT